METDDGLGQCNVEGVATGTGVEEDQATLPRPSQSDPASMHWVTESHNFSVVTFCQNDDVGSTGLLTSHQPWYSDAASVANLAVGGQRRENV